MAVDAFRPVERGDIAHIAANLWEPERLELVALYGDAPTKDIVARAVLLSSLCWTWTIDNEPAGIFGVAPVSLLEGCGAPWFLRTERGSTRPRALIRHAPRYVGRMLELYPHLVNYVDARNERSVRWLAHIGFEIRAPAPLGRQGELFHRFEMQA